MNKVVMFTGQGSQKLNMGEDLFEKYPSEIASANEVLGYDIREVCRGHVGELNNTLYTQPTLFVVNYLEYMENWYEHRLEISFFIGHSLGEYNALCASGVFDFTTGLRLVQKRAQLMSQSKGGSMLAVMGMENDHLEKILKDNGDKIDMANINSNGQVVIAGLEKDIIEIVEPLKAGGAKKVIPLEVSGAFHSRYMFEVKKEFKDYIRQEKFGEISIPVISNKEALPYSESQIIDTLCDQIDHRVRFVEMIQYIRSQGDFEYVEIGPRAVLKGLLRRI